MVNCVKVGTVCGGDNATTKVIDKDAEVKPVKLTFGAAFKEYGELEVKLHNAKIDFDNRRHDDNFDFDYEVEYLDYLALRIDDLRGFLWGI